MTTVNQKIEPLILKSLRSKFTPLIPAQAAVVVWDGLGEFAIYIKHTFISAN